MGTTIDDQTQRFITMEVTGMTCENCVKHVSEELDEIEGIKNVEVILDKEGTSKVTLVADREIDDAALREAVAEAGEYDVTSISR